MTDENKKILWRCVVKECGYEALEKEFVTPTGHKCPKCKGGCLFLSDAGDWPTEEGSRARDDGWPIYDDD